MGLLDAIFGGGDGGYSAAMDSNKKNRALLDAIELPKYSDYTPEAAQYELIKEDPSIRASQMAALAKMSGLAESGQNSEDELAFLKARQNADQMAKANREAVLSNAQARGVGGSGLEFAMKEMGNQAGATNAQNAGLEQTANSARNRVLYNNAYMTGLGNQRQQDLNVNQANTGIINRFNEINTNNKNQAQQYNNDLRQRNFNNQMTKATGQINNNNQEAQYGMDNETAKAKRRSALTGAIGAGIGAAYGGPQGAGVGYAIGSGL